MNKSNLWLVVVVTAMWIGFLFGYAMSSHTGTKGTAAAPAAVAAPSAGGYGR
jgi:hypothetical protein